MSTTQPFAIPRSTNRCASTGETLVPGEMMVVVLLEGESEEELERLDYALKAWEGGARPSDDRRIFATWRTQVHEPGKKQDAIISADGLLDLFEQLGEAEEPKRLAFRYVLALMLMRKRQLEYVGTKEGKLLVMPKGAEEGAEPIEVHDPQASGELDEQALAELVEQVEQVLDPGDA